jgi:spore maturation protein A
MIVGIGIMIFTNPANAISTMITASEKSVALCINLIAIYAVWLGLLKILEDTGACKKLAKILSPFIDFLFGYGIDEETKSFIAINISSNILGLGNAATPSAINAMKGLDDKTGKINNAMTMLMVVNCLSFQLFPTTIMGLRASAGSTNASSIIFPTILTSIIVGVFTITLLKIIFSIKNKRLKKYDK